MNFFLKVAILVGLIIVLGDQVDAHSETSVSHKKAKGLVDLPVKVVRWGNNKERIYILRSVDGNKGEIQPVFVKEIDSDADIKKPCNCESVDTNESCNPCVARRFIRMRQRERSNPNTARIFGGLFGGAPYGGGYGYDYDMHYDQYDPYSYYGSPFGNGYGGGYMDGPFNQPYPMYNRPFMF